MSDDIGTINDVVSDAAEVLESNENLETGEENLNDTSDSLDVDDPGSSDGEEGESLQDIQEEINKLKRLTIKHNGKEYEEELPFEIDDTPEAVEYMKKQLQLAKQSQTKSQDFSKLQKEVEGFINELRSNPRKVLADPNINVDVKELVNQIIQEEIENSSKSPEQLAKEELERELKTLKDERQKEREQQKQQEYDLLLDREYEKFDYQMSQALESSDLPKSPYVVKKMTEYLAMGIQAGMDISADDVLGVVHDEIVGDINEMFQVMPLEVIEQMLGNDNVSKLRKRRVAKARKTAPPGKTKIKDVGEKGTKQEQTISPQTFKDFFGV